MFIFYFGYNNNPTITLLRPAVARSTIRIREKLAELKMAREFFLKNKIKN